VLSTFGTFSRVLPTADRALDLLVRRITFGVANPPYLIGPRGSIESVSVSKKRRFRAAVLQPDEKRRLARAASTGTCFPLIGASFPLHPEIIECQVIAKIS
jgi:hypothetical protein